MLSVSPKGTVPVLCVDGQVIDQSLDIMRWALNKSDPYHWKRVDDKIASDWIEKNDGSFKMLLDQYKYPNRHPELNLADVLKAVSQLMLEPMERALKSTSYLLGNQMTWVDIAIFPFIRQFAMVSPEQFSKLPYPAIQQWLDQQIQSELFNAVMEKHPTWTD
jgi:glutathione S-transferase